MERLVHYSCFVLQLNSLLSIVWIIKVYWNFPQSVVAGGSIFHHLHYQRQLTGDD